MLKFNCYFKPLSVLISDGGLGIVLSALVKTDAADFAVLSGTTSSHANLDPQSIIAMIIRPSPACSLESVLFSKSHGGLITQVSMITTSIGGFHGQCALTKKR